MREPHTVYIEDDEQYEKLKRIKKKYVLMWKGLLLQGARRMEGNDAIEAVGNPCQSSRA